LEFDLAAPQGFEPRYADPELMDHIDEEPGLMLTIQSLTQTQARTEALSRGIEKARFSSYWIKAYGTFTAHTFRV
jgi:hypothetical protein